MITTFPIGFISYNSKEFLHKVLLDFIAKGIFGRCYAFYHKSLDNEKNHFHVYIEPLFKIDTSKLEPYFKEIDENGDDQSIAVKPRCKSDFTNWFLYAKHDDVYLEYKGLLRENINLSEDNNIIIGDFSIDIELAFKYRFDKCLCAYDKLYSLVSQGFSLSDVLRSCRTPFALFNVMADAYRFIERAVANDKSDLEDISKK